MLSITKQHIPLMESNRRYNKEDFNKALQHIKNGGVILYPTDTIWGIGCDATNEKAVERIYEIKKRSTSKSMIILMDFPARIDRYINQMPEIAWDLIEVANKPLTIIYTGAKNLAPNVINEDGSIGIRIVDDPFCRDLITRFNKPIVSTSANISGEKSPEVFSDILEEIIHSVDYIVQHRQDDISPKTPSGIVKVGANGEIKVIRK